MTFVIWGVFQILLCLVLCLTLSEIEGTKGKGDKGGRVIVITTGWASGGQGGHGGWGGYLNIYIHISTKYNTEMNRKLK